jgi:predicted O-methyltransferase YrrM
MAEFPPLVLRARALAREAGFPLSRAEAGPDRASACLPGTGRFLAMLAAGCAGGRIGELGTGAGVGAAWLAGAMPADCALVTAELDERLAAAARDLFAGDPRVEVITGDAAAAMSGRGPFDLLFADSGVRDEAGFAALVGLLRAGGRIVMDDLTPQRVLASGDSRPASDDLKRRFFSDARLTSAEIVLPDLQNSLLAGTRTR